ncbi:MAG: hypothetical protein UU64_C0018G0003 [candidate division WWE3 bacterium GW2011_GWF2_41_45]|nr:MAG: hypothetical protein UU64_C0018G0003 [candidate division WWE3 bacterium GW2011_GWF2_41_45]KKS54301.1 MAG: hypothetical protein UV21_C0011G0003 [candidate division WWE3 bacterium GW2011_GWD2_42_34]
MYISKLTILNYKSCKLLNLDFNKDLANTFIGLNDTGKTVILESIANVLDNHGLNVETDGHLTCDVSNTALEEETYKKVFRELGLPEFKHENNNITLVCTFDLEENDLDDEFVENSSDQLRWSIESFSQNKIILLKHYTPLCPKGKYFLCARDAISSPLELWKQTKTTVESQMTQNGVTQEDIINENKVGRFTNLEKIRAVYSKMVTETQWSEYADYTKKDRSLFPVFRYLDWKITMKDIEEMAKDTMSLKIEDFKKDLLTKASDLSKEASKVINEELKGKTATILTSLSNVKALKVGINFTVEENVSDLVIEKTTSDGDIKLESQGEGIKKQIWFAFLRWASMENIGSDEVSKRFIWCFDEPEVHLYPTAQREFHDIIKNLSSGVFQTFISTHSTIFIDRVNVQNICRVNLENGYTTCSTTKSIDDIHEALGVKNSDILFFDKFFAVEGDTDQYLIPYFFKLYKNKSIAEDSIQLVNLRGATNKANNVNLLRQILKDFKKDSQLVYYYFDGDQLHDNSINACYIGKYDIEDSIANNVWIQVVKSYCNVNITNEELDSLRANLENSSSKKFYKLLSDLVKKKQGDGEYKVLPAKGRELAEELMRFISATSQIPIEIKNSFDQIA